jgi:hypothetical protein
MEWLNHGIAAVPSDAMGLLGILVGLGVLIWLTYQGWSVLLVGPAAALLAAAFAGEALLANWTQTFMAAAARFIAQFFPLFLLGALFGKLMDDSGSALAIARAGRAVGPGAGDPCHRACRHDGIDRDERQIRLFSIELSADWHFRAAGAAGQAPEADDDGPPRLSFEDAPCPRCSLSTAIQNIGLE